MVTLALRIGNRDFGFAAGTLEEWLHLLLVLPLTVCGFAILGAVIGAIFRRRLVLQMLSSVLSSCAIVLYFIARDGMFSSKFSLSEKIEGLYELSGVYILFCIAPAVLASLFVGQRLMRRKTI